MGLSIQLSTQNTVPNLTNVLRDVLKTDVDQRFTFKPLRLKDMFCCELSLNSTAYFEVVGLDIIKLYATMLNAPQHKGGAFLQMNARFYNVFG